MPDGLRILIKIMLFPYMDIEQLIPIIDIFQLLIMFKI